MTGLENLVLECDKCDLRISAKGFLSKYVGEFKKEVRDELVSGSCMVSCIRCDGGVLSTSSGFSVGENLDNKPSFWGFD